MWGGSWGKIRKAPSPTTQQQIAAFLPPFLALSKENARDRREDREIIKGDRKTLKGNRQNMINAGKRMVSTLGDPTRRGKEGRLGE